MSGRTGRLKGRRGGRRTDKRTGGWQTYEQMINHATVSQDMDACPSGDYACVLEGREAAGGNSLLVVYIVREEAEKTG